MPIHALPLAHAELRDVLSLAGPQFATCKLGRSQYSGAGPRTGRQEVGGEGQSGPLPPGPGLACLPGPHLAALSLTAYPDCPRLADGQQLPARGSLVACTVYQLPLGLWFEAVQGGHKVDHRGLQSSLVPSPIFPPLYLASGFSPVSSLYSLSLHPLCSLSLLFGLAWRCLSFTSTFAGILLPLFLFHSLCFPLSVCLSSLLSLCLCLSPYLVSFLLFPSCLQARLPSLLSPQWSAGLQPLRVKVLDCSHFPHLP